MIKIDRNQVKEPDILTQDNADPQGEKQRVILFHEESQGSKVEYKIYRKAKEDLKTLFDQKCAYCEGLIGHIDHPHIEHWRPKGEVTGQANHKGYYWLASEWDNLLLSCAVCNTGFKRNKFPLAPGSPYATCSKDDLNLEKPLLINPCNEDPKDYFGYRNGFIFGNGKKGEVSIETYGLDRSLLTSSRRKDSDSIKRLLEGIREDIEDAIDIPGSEQKYKKRMNKKKEELITLISPKPENQYRGMCLYILQEEWQLYSNNFVFQKIVGEILAILGQTYPTKQTV